MVMNCKDQHVIDDKWVEVKRSVPIDKIIVERPKHLYDLDDMSSISKQKQTIQDYQHQDIPSDEMQFTSPVGSEKQ